MERAGGRRSKRRIKSRKRIKSQSKMKRRIGKDRSVWGVRAGALAP
jgi:hypothetical protein